MATRYSLPSSSMKIAGTLLLVAGVIILMGIITAEALYPQGYSTFGNEISDLGATKPPGSIIYQPSAAIFDGIMLVGGLMVMLAAFFTYRAYTNIIFTIILGLFGLGIFGVGIFPGNYGEIHRIFYLIAFIFGGIAAILTYQVVSQPFKYVTVILGVISLMSLLTAVFFADFIYPLIGDGGIERWVAYPIILWMCGSGGYISSSMRT